MITKINSFTPAISYKRTVNNNSFRRNNDADDKKVNIHNGFTCENYVDIDSVGGTTIFGLQEIMRLKDFAIKCKDNVALKIVPSTVIDAKYVKSQTDLINNQGKWLNITDYDDM